MANSHPHSHCNIDSIDALHKYNSRSLDRSIGHTNCCNKVLGRVTRVVASSYCTIAHSILDPNYCSIRCYCIDLHMDHSIVKGVNRCPSNNPDLAGRYPLLQMEKEELVCLLSLMNFLLVLKPVPLVVTPLQLYRHRPNFVDIQGIRLMRDPHTGRPAQVQVQSQILLQHMLLLYSSHLELRIHYRNHIYLHNPCYKNHHQRTQSHTIRYHNLRRRRMLVQEVPLHHRHEPVAVLALLQILPAFSHNI